MLPGDIDEVLTAFEEPSDWGDDAILSDIDPTSARARATEAIHNADISFFPLTSDKWPTCRPLIEWVARLLPDGGRGFIRLERDDEARATLTEAFFASSYAKKLDGSDHRDLLDSILSFGIAWALGDPLHWGPISVDARRSGPSSPFPTRSAASGLGSPRRPSTR